MGSAEHWVVPRRDARSRGVSWGPSLRSLGLLGLGAWAGGSPGTWAKPCMMSFCLPPNCGVGVGWRCPSQRGRPNLEDTCRSSLFGFRFAGVRFFSTFGEVEYPKPSSRPEKGAGGGRSSFVPHHLVSGPQLGLVLEACLPVPHEKFGAAGVAGESKTG